MQHQIFLSAKFGNENFYDLTSIRQISQIFPPTEFSTIRYMQVLTK